MRFIDRIKRLKGISVWKFIYYNWLDIKVHRDKGCFLVPYRGAVISLEKGASIELHEHFFLNYNKINGSKAEVYLKLHKNSKLYVNGASYLNYLSTIELHENASLTLGGTYINCGTVVMVGNKMSIGKDVLISRNCMIYDSDFHKTGQDENNLQISQKEVIIGDHVWIGIRTTILKGAKIEDGVVIGAESMVASKIKHNMFAMGNPARAFSTIYWGD